MPGGIWIKIHLNPNNNWVHFLNDFLFLVGPEGFGRKTPKMRLDTIGKAWRKKQNVSSGSLKVESIDIS
jgi:hypothetical protein